jgi:hypothetical protein
MPDNSILHGHYYENRDSRTFVHTCLCSVQ